MISNKPNLLVNLFFVINAKDPNIIEIAIIVTPKYITTCDVDQKKSGSFDIWYNESYIPPIISKNKPMITNIDNKSDRCFDSKM